MSKSKTKTKVSPSEDERTTTVHPPCMSCAHLIEVGTRKSLEGWTCSAFPGGILYAILTRAERHTRPLIGIQEGADVYEPKQVYDYPDGRNWQTFDGEWVTEKEAKGS
jgi:hypothetical protein